MSLAVTSGAVAAPIDGADKVASQPSDSASGSTRESPEALKARWFDQQIETLRAAAHYLDAKLAREAAEKAAADYESQELPREIEDISRWIEIAEMDLTRAQDRVNWAARMSEKGFLSKSQKVGEELRLQKARFDLEQAQSRKTVLLNYVRDKTVRKYRSELEKARAIEQTAAAAWEASLARDVELSRLLDGEAAHPEAERRVADSGTQAADRTVKPPATVAPTKTRTTIIIEPVE
jgi:hypothetical protein